MIEKQRTYQYQVIEERNLHFDFEALYDYIAKANNTDDPYFIGDDFGDNAYYYIEHIFGIKLQSYENEEVNHYNNELLDDIANDFNNWIEQNKIDEIIRKEVPKDLLTHDQFIRVSEMYRTEAIKEINKITNLGLKLSACYYDEYVK